MKSIKSIAHSVLNFNIPPLWLAVGSLVVFNVWQAYEILDMKKQVSSHAMSVELAHTKPIEMTVYVAKGGTVYHWRETCSGLVSELRGQDNGASYTHFGMSDAEKKYSKCPRCFYTEPDPDAFIAEERRRWEEGWEEEKMRRWGEEWDYDEKVRRSLERQGIIDRY